MAGEHHRFTVGAFTCVAVCDGGFGYPPGLLFANAPEEERTAALQAHGEPTDEVYCPYTCLVVDTGRERVLIDTGMGPGFPGCGQLPDVLREAGYPAEAIDVVLLSHAHPDHVGGCTDAEGYPAFPNARYVLGREEWEFWTNPDNLAALDEGRLWRLGDLDRMMADLARRNLPTIRERVDLIEPEQEVVGGILAIDAPGHTPGHLAFAIESGGERLYYTGDVASRPIHLEHPDWYAGVDLEPERALATRRRLFDRIAAERAMISVYHFPFPGLARISPAPVGWAWERVE